MSEKKMGKIAHLTQKIARMTQSLEAPKSFAIGYFGFLCFLAILLCCLMLLVQVRTESYRLGYKIEALQKEKGKLQQELLDLRIRQAQASSVESLVRMNHALQIYLLPPEEWLELPEKAKGN